jgi:sigma-B regulation protein RsbU (phosphoserine phosphatase)
VTDPGEALRLLLTASYRAGPRDIAELARGVAPALDATDVAVYLVDYGQTDLLRLAERDGAAIPVDGTLAGRAFATGQVYDSGSDGETHVWVPLLDGAQRLGVVEIRTKTPPSAQQRHTYELVAALLAQLVTTRRNYGDAVEHTRRKLPMQVATEIVWGLLPPLTFVDDAVAVSGILEPCYEVGGDVFDYAVNGEVAHLALFDAVGHGTSASMLSTIGLNAYRNARRCGLDLVDTYRSVDKWVRAEYPEAFLTAILAELDLTTGHYRRICAGHLPEMLFRDGRLIKRLAGETTLPLGMGDLASSPPSVTDEGLQPGDMLLLYTDGVIEARSESGEFFGEDRLAGFLSRALADHLPPAETMRRLIRAILEHQHEQLQDDATALCMQWLAGREMAPF